MLTRIASLRFQLLLAMLGTGAIALAGAYFAIARIEHAEERAILAQDAQESAIAIAAELDKGIGFGALRRQQAALGSDQVIVRRGGRTVFAGPSSASDLTATATRPFRGGSVTVVAHGVENPRGSIDLTLVAAGVVLLVMAAAVATATLLQRAVSGPLQRAIDAADRVAAGDLSARIGDVAPEEFGRLARAFDGMAGRLEQADHDQRAFLADIAHEIATPLNAVSGHALALADGSASEPAERETAERIVRSESERLHGLLEDLRNLTELDLLETGTAAEIDVAELGRDLLFRLTPSADEAGIAIRADLAPLGLLTNRRLLESVLVNLLSNAIRYTPAGGSVELRVRRGRRHAVLAVRDTGIGIAQEHQARVFERLYRVDSARDRGTGGSGLGLAIAARAARALGGRIELDSAPGRGSEFRLVLPLPTRRRTRIRRVEPGAVS